MHPSAKRLIFWTGESLQVHRTGAAKRPGSNPVFFVFWHPVVQLKAIVFYAQLVEKLAEIGVQEKEVNVRNKLSRGTFTAGYLLQCLEAIGCHTLHLA